MNFRRSTKRSRNQPSSHSPPTLRKYLHLKENWPLNKKSVSTLKHACQSTSLAIFRWKKSFLHKSNSSSHSSHKKSLNSLPNSRLSSTLSPSFKPKSSPSTPSTKRKSFSKKTRSSIWKKTRKKPESKSLKKSRNSRNFSPKLIRNVKTKRPTLKI